MVDGTTCLWARLVTFANVALFDSTVTTKLMSLMINVAFCTSLVQQQCRRTCFGAALSSSESWKFY